MPISITFKWLMGIKLFFSLFSVFIDADHSTRTTEQKSGRPCDANQIYYWALPNVKCRTWWTQHVEIIKKIFTKYLACKVKSTSFLKSGLNLWFCFIEFFIIFTRIKRYCCNKINTLHYKKLFLPLCQGFPICLSILKRVSKIL